MSSEEGAIPAASVEEPQVLDTTLPDATNTETPLAKEDETITASSSTLQKALSTTLSSKNIALVKTGADSLPESIPLEMDTSPSDVQLQKAPQPVLPTPSTLDEENTTVITHSTEKLALDENLYQELVQQRQVALTTLTGYIKSLVTLTKYKQDMWTPEHDGVVHDFLTTRKGTRARLIVFIDPSDESTPALRVQAALPDQNVEQLMYFISNTTNPILPHSTSPIAVASVLASEEEIHDSTPQLSIVPTEVTPVEDKEEDGEINIPMSLNEFEGKVQFGTIESGFMESFLRLMQGVYVPAFIESKRWPDTVRKEFISQMHKFMAVLTDTTFQMKGHTVLYVPNENLENPESSAKTKDLVQRLETLLIHWTRQIKEVVNNQHTSETRENSGPLEEIQFWRSRVDDLSSISQQLNRVEVQQILFVLDIAKSSYLEQFLHLSHFIQEGMVQAQDNLRFLSTLTESCEQLSIAEPKKIASILPKLLNCVRIIWANSKYYNTKEQLTGLFRKVSNEIIKRCCSKISLDEIFHGDVQLSTQNLQDSVNCGENWKVIYKKMCVHVLKYTKTTGWDFDQSSIFAQIDAFVQRCRDLLEVCEGQIQFARKINNGKKAAIPCFGGSKGPEIGKSLEDIEIAFEKSLAVLWNIRKHILDVKATIWHDVYNNFKQGVKDLEIMMQNVIMSAFECANTVDSSVELLEIFHHLAKREPIKRTVEKKTADVYTLFIQELNAVKVEFESHRKAPLILRSHPDFAGSAFWARSLQRRIAHSYNILKEAYYLPHTALADEAKSQYEPLVDAFDEYIMKTHAEWIASINPLLTSKLDDKLMTRKPGDSLEMKFDKDILRLFSEIHYWQKLKMDIPFNVQELYSKREELRVLRENVLLVVRDYNNIVATLSREEQNLFRERIRFLDRKMNPGLSILTWGSKGITEYFVKECRRHCNDVQQTVQSFIESNQLILKNFQVMADTSLWRIENKKVYDLEEFESAQEEYRVVAQNRLFQAHEQIKNVLHSLFEIFRNDGRDVYLQWIKYVEKIDKGIEESLRLTVKRTLQEISKAINGEGKNKDGAVEVHAIFKVNVVLEQQKVDLQPTLQKMEEIVTKAVRNMVSIIGIVPRLTDVLALDTTKETKKIYDVISSEEDIIKISSAMQTGMLNNATKCQAYLKTWDAYREIWEINKDAFIRRYAKLKPALSTFDADISRYNEVANNAQKEETLININFVRLDCSPLKHSLVSHCSGWQNKLTTLLNTNASTDLRALHDMFQQKSKKLKTPPKDLDQLCNSLALLSQLTTDLAATESQFGPIREQYQILEKYEVPIAEEEKILLENLKSAWASFQCDLADADKELQESKAKFKTELLSSVDEFTRNVIILRDEFAAKGPFTSSLDVPQALKSIADYKLSIENFAANERSLRKGLTVFKIDQPPNKDIENITVQLDALSQIWTLTEEWNELYNTWKSIPFLSLDGAEIEEHVQKFLKRLLKMGKEIKEKEVFISIKDRVNHTKRTVPVLLELKNPAMRDRHWNKLIEEVGKPFNPHGDDFTLEKILELGLDQYAEQISTISGAATKELSIEQGLLDIEKSWEAMDLDISPYKEEKGYFRIKGTDGIFELLEDNQVGLSSMKSSKFFLAFEKQVDHWERALTRVVEIIELLLTVQRQWMYLENIFGTDDIRKQLPKESAIFDSVNVVWKITLERMLQDRNVLKATHLPDLNETLTDMNSKLEKVQKSLDMYLETKRMYFPRFYFISNDDLLEILGQAKDPNAIQSHLKKCFDNIFKLELAADSRRRNEAFGMYSGDGEYVQFHSPVILDGPVEAWLTDIESAMRVTLRKLMPGTLLAMKKVKKDKWLKDWPGMSLITSTLISWTYECTKALQDAENGEKNSLKSLKRKQVSGLKKFADLVKTPLSKIDRSKLIAIITVEVHSRDVIDKMIKSNCSSVNAFDWLSQLRFYWEKENREDDDCYIRQINTHFRFGYEYLGNSGRLVITPLTDRCYMTLTSALHLHRGGSPQGPAGTGKTETVKDLGKALGKYVIVLNCSDALDYKAMGRMFSGISQTGAWGCFDEFNRIYIEVLSVVALQISSILSAIARNAKSFVFEGREIKLIPSCGIFITMNPGYAGRTELPDNLKSLFRPVSMMVPDSALIAEIMLFAEGFSNTRVLAKKADTLYRLAIQQLSKQDHYDFQLRALTSALRNAGLRKRIDPNAPDESLLYMAMKDNNVPKLTADDTPLFMGMLSDLFPGVEATAIDYTDFNNVLVEEMKLKNTQPIPSMMKKVTQLHETKVTRHGVMIVGATGSAKTTTWKLLQSTLTKLSKQFPEKYSPVKVFMINPKALSLGELYGEVNMTTNEWTDGVLSNIMRAACSDEKKDQKWIILDGPVDTLWIESMNTVLDDNKVLTLINGERIAMPEQVSLLFEVENLSTASPATVSRAGMIYMDYADLGWRPYMDSWMEQRVDSQSIEILKRLADKYIEKTLEFKRLSCSEFVPISEMNAIKSLCNLFDSVATAENGVNPNDASYTKMIELWFLFSMIWSLGGSLTDESRKKFDMFLREIEGQFPSKDTVYEYCVDKYGATWTSWEEKLQSGWRYNTSIPFYKIFVPTVDTLRNEFICKSLIVNKKPLLLVGDVGTGKTSLIQNVLASLDESSLVLCANMSAQTSSNALQSLLESKVEKRTKNVFVPLGGKNLVAFIDDLNMPMKDTFGSQAALEFIRHWIDYGFFYDRQKQTTKYLNDLLIVAAMGPPGGGRNSMSPRIQSRFNVINMTFPSEYSVNKIYGTIINQKLQDFEEDVKPLGELMTKSTLEIYHTIVANLLPTPSKIHYLFNLRDISKVFQGLLRANKEYFDSRESITKLWIHESCRVFYDRLVDKDDRDFFIKMIDEKLINHFGTSLKQVCPERKLPIFGDFMGDAALDTPVYEEILDTDRLKKFMEEKQVEYNSEPGYVQINLVLFNDAIEHLCRITRILRQSNGHVFLIGVGGSGRQSLTRLAAYVVEIGVFQIKISKHYRHIEFREDLKALFKMTGLEAKPTAFLFTDAQILNNSFLEDLSNILSSGDVPNLFTVDEMTEIKSLLSDAAKVDRIPENAEAMGAYFLERVRNNLHVVLCMSPAGEPFRSRLRMFPSLVNCTSIDWFSAWPEDALAEVALKYLEGVELESESMKKAVSQMFVSIHTSVSEISQKMLHQLKRYNFVTPTNYLELVSGYRILLKEKRMEIGNAAMKLKNGLSKLDDTKQSVEKISVELEVSKKQVVLYQKQCEDFLVIIVQQKREADEQAKGVAATAEKLGIEEQEVLVVAKAAQEDLDEALPILNAATKALESLNKKDLNEIRSYSKPPPLVEKVLEAVMILKKSEPTWDEAKRQLGNPYFIKQLINFDKDNVSDKILKKISQYCADESFAPDVVGRVSGAAKSLCMWVRAIESYGLIYRQVAPKKEKLRNATEVLEKKQSSLKEAKDNLQAIQDKLSELKNQYDEKANLKEKLRKESEETELKLTRAEQLVSGLSGERGRWENSIKLYEQSILYLPGDCLLAAGFLSYVGPFNSVYRQELVAKTWLAQIKNLEIPFTPNFKFEEFLGNPTTIREWNLQELPSDTFSSENGIIVTRGTRWPLMIDPQGQANRWIKNMETKRGLKIIDLKQLDFLKTLEQAIQFGTPVLLHGLSETIDPALDPILNKSIVKKGGVLTIKIGDKDIEYNPEFRFYLTTKMANPRYSPEIFAKATIVNFAVKEKGLEDQLLGIVVKREKPDLEEQKNTLVFSVANAKRKLLELEDEILHLLSTAQGSLLDDAKLVNTLQSSKSTAEEVTQQLIVSEQTEKRIDAAREAYRPCAQRASILYFVLNELSTIDPMYQFSLDSYIELFDKSISKSKKHEDINERIINLNEYHTYSVYKSTCRGLFEHHKLLFSFQMTVKIMEAANKLNKDEFDFFLRGAIVLNRENQLPNPSAEWITELAWDNIVELENFPVFGGLPSAIDQGERDWKLWFLSGEPETAPLPGEWENKLNELQRILVVRSLRPDRVVFCSEKFISVNLGQKYIEPPNLDVQEILGDSSPRIPLIFVLSPGVDPTSTLQQLAAKKGMSDRFSNVALGQGQAPKATKMIQDGLKEGHWVFLANCHLSISWMPLLEKIIEGIPGENPHPDFRLLLSSSPHPEFPISILQNSIKMTTEPPKGLKANLCRLYNNVTTETFSKSNKPEIYQKLLFSLSFFHSVLLERKKFLTLGWNVVCDFNDSDFEVCENLLVVLLDAYEDTPWDALKYLIAEANYGGRITDDWDRRVLRSYINTLFCNEAITIPQYKVSTMSNYYIPDSNELQAFKDYTSSLPSFDKPEVFGQHPNADITSQIKESGNLLNNLLSLQPQAASGAGVSREEKVLTISLDIRRHLPDDLDYEYTYKMVKQDMTPLNVVLLQEVSRYNNLLQLIRKSLSDLENGIKGIVLMSPELEETYANIYEGKVPHSWNKAYLSLKPLASWTRDLGMRIEFFNEWSKGVEPKCYWLGAFSFPTGFFTAVLQKTARKNNIPIDVLSWEFSVLQLEDERVLPPPPKEGVYVKGIALEGASWDIKNNCLKEPKSMELITQMPPIHFKPVDVKKKLLKGIYTCPLYYYPIRSGTREKPSFIIAMDLKSGNHDSDFYVKRGTAALSTLS